MSGDLAFTGERFIPGTPGEIWLEHWHRYHFAARWVAGKRVLDVACGEGYGSALLARSAALVTGVDISPQAIEHARAEYGRLSNARFACASCTQLPLPDASVDIAISFETLEHIHEQEAFIDELARVLAPGGVLLISCPNKVEYTDNRGFVNEFHVKELYREELRALLERRFPAQRWHGQRPTFYSVIAPEGGAAAAGQLVELAEAAPAEAATQIAKPLYFIIAAARDEASAATIPMAVSVLSDLDDYLHRDYAKVIREVRDLHGHRVRLEGLVAERDRSVADLHSMRLGLEGALAQRLTQLEARDGELETARAALEAARLALEEKAREVDRRRGWRWWLRLPFIRMGLID